MLLIPKLIHAIFYVSNITDENAQGGLDDSQNQPSIKRPKTSGCKESVPRSVTLEHSIAGGSRSNHLQPQGTPRAWGAGWGRVRGRGVRGNMPQTVGLAKNARHMESDINPTGVSLNHLHYKTLARRPENKKEHYVSHAVTIDQGGEARLNHLQQEIVYTKPHTFGPKNNDLTGADSSGTVPVTLPDQQKTSLLKGFYEGWRAGFKGAEDVTVPFIFPEKLIPIMARQKTPENTRHTGADSSGTVPETLTDQFKTSFLKGFYEGWRAGFKPVKRTNDAVPLIIPRELIATTLDKEFISKFTTRQRAGLLLSMNKDRPQTEITLDSYCQTCEENGGNKVLSRSSRRDEGITQSEPKEMQDEEQPTDTTDAVQGFVSNNDSSSTDTKIDDSEPSSLNDDSCSVSSSEAEFRRKAWLAIAPLYETGAWE